MYHWLKSRLANFFSIFGLGLLRSKDLAGLKTLEISAESFDIDFELATRLSRLSDVERYRNSRNESKSALRQDLLCLLVNGWKENGYFIEFGACDGMFVSNTFILEKNFGWDGILSEPARKWHGELKSNRNCILEHRAVWKQSDLNLPFFEMEAPGLSRIATEISGPVSSRLRKKYSVPSISLKDLLVFHSSPKMIDYLSIDTEGSEFEILSEFDFKSYKFNFISIEHNYEPYRNLIYELMIKNGYVRILSSISKYEDWYIPEENVDDVALKIESLL